MTPITALDLSELDINAPAFWADPNPFVADARRKHAWLAKCAIGYVLTDYQSNKDLLSMDDKLRTPNKEITALMNAEGTPWGRWNNEFLLAHSGEKHRRLRNLVAPTFTPKIANLYRPIMRSVVSELLDEWAPKGHFDFAVFASYFPITVMCRLIGARSGVVPLIKDALETMGSGFSLDPSLTPALNGAFATLWDFVDALIKERRAQGSSAQQTSDLLNALISANLEGDRLNDVELHDLLILLFGAGYDTSKNLLGMIMHLMLDRPDQWARVAHDRAFSDSVIEEALRHSSVVTTYRLANQDIHYREIAIPKDTLLVFPLPIAGRDPEVFKEPLVFDPARPAQAQRHLAFGRGLHICLGQFIARAQTEEGLPLIARRLIHPRRGGKVEWRPFPGIWGVRRLPMVFDPVSEA
jgi:cytochrome P450